MRDKLILSLFALFCLSLCENASAYSNISPIPLNFIEGIDSIRNKLEVLQHYSKTDFNFIHQIPFSQNQFITDVLEKFSLIRESKKINLPNITTPCTNQLFELLKSLKSSQTWALSGIYMF